MTTTETLTQHVRALVRALCARARILSGRGCPGDEALIEARPTASEALAVIERLVSRQPGRRALRQAAEEARRGEGHEGVLEVVCLDLPPGDLREWIGVEAWEVWVSSPDRRPRRIWRGLSPRVGLRVLRTEHAMDAAEGYRPSPLLGGGETAAYWVGGRGGRRVTLRPVPQA